MMVSQANVLDEEQKQVDNFYDCS